MAERRTIDVIVRLSQKPISLPAWLAAVLSIVTIRTLLENFSSPGAFGSLDVAFSTWLHYALFYIGLALAVALLVSRFGRLPSGMAIRLVPFFLPIIWLAPLVDLLLTGGQGQPMAYVFADIGGLASALLTFYGNAAAAGITGGMRLELAIMMVAAFLFIRGLRRDWRPALLGTGLLYLTVFLWLTLPSWLFLAGSAGWPGQPETMGYFRLLSGSSLSAFSLNDPLIGLPPDSGLAMFFNALMSRVHLLLATLLAGLWYFWSRRQQFLSVLANSRPERVIHWWLLIGLGVVFAWLRLNRLPNSWYDWLAVAMVALAFYFAWLFAVGTNDVADAPLDAVSNPKRPIPAGHISVGELSAVSGLLLGLALLAAYLAGPTVLFAVAGFSAAYWVYSMPPLRLKRWPVINPLLISLACLSAAVAGFFVMAPGLAIAEFPGRLALLIIVAFTLAANVKDLKDVPGDRQEGIATLPVLLGPRYGQPVVAVLVGLSIWLVPLILNLPILAITALPAGLLAYPAVAKRPYREIRVFILYYLFIAASFALLVLIR